MNPTRARDKVCVLAVSDTIVTWDGCLPLLVAAAPTLLPAIVPDRDLAELSAFLLLPMLAALLRTYFGYRQLERLGTPVPLGRQFLFGCGIVALLLFEGVAAMLQFAPGAPPVAWTAAGTLYAAYLALIMPALRPRKVSIANAVQPRRLARDHQDTRSSSVS